MFPEILEEAVPTPSRGSSDPRGAWGAAPPVFAIIVEGEVSPYALQLVIITPEATAPPVPPRADALSLLLWSPALFVGEDVDAVTSTRLVPSVAKDEAVLLLLSEECEVFLPWSKMIDGRATTSS